MKNQTTPLTSLLYVRLMNFVDQYPAQQELRKRYCTVYLRGEKEWQK